LKKKPYNPFSKYTLPHVRFSRRKNPDSRNIVSMRAARTEQERFAMWWHGVYNDGVLLKNPQLVKGQDYLGELPWPKAVTLRSVYNEYVSDTKSKCSIEEFWRMAKPVCKYSKFVHKSVPIVYTEQSLSIRMGRKGVSFYTFPRDILTDAPWV